ncbi:Zinc finger, CCHC-type superfamily [Sesbania bispinosa]|nr:Zinc finger, CCHC-type superfamily [Sesbania bispinosa]
MEFSSLKEFKEAILQHSVLNGREVYFEKNDKLRVRARCKQSCDWLAFVSKVGGSSTYRLKTLFSTHTCGRVFNNKNAKSKWVAKKVADRFRSGQGVRLVDIIGDIRTGYATGISTKYACGYCHQYGHNTRKCPLRPVLVEPTPLNELQPQNGSEAAQDAAQNATEVTQDAAEVAQNDVQTTVNQATQSTGTKGKGKGKVAPAVPRKGRPPAHKKNKSSTTKGESSNAARPTQPSGPTPHTTAPPTAAPPTAARPTQPNEFQPGNQFGHIEALKNAHNMTKLSYAITKVSMPPKLVEANNIFHELLGVAQEVTSGNNYDWRRVVEQLGLTQDEGYMGFMEQMEATKISCHSQNVNQTTANEEGGTQQNEVTSTNQKI